MERDSKFIIVGIVVILMLVIAGSLLVSVKPGVSEPIKIGFVGPLTGDVAVAGIPAKQAVELAIEEINKNGGINSRNLSLIAEDGMCNAKDAANAGNKLVNIDGVKFIVGGFCSGETLAIAPITEKNKVLLISPASTSPLITNAGDYVFRNVPSDTYQGAYAANLLFNKYNKKRVAILFINNDWGIGNKDAFKNKFAALGGSILAEESYDPTTLDVRTQLTRIKTTDIDAIYLVAQPKDTQIALIQAKELGINTLIIGADASGDAESLKAAGDAANGFLWIEPKSKTSQEFINRYKQKYGKEPIIYSAQAYDIAYLYANAMKVCNEDSVCIKNELYKVKDYQGASGVITLDSNGDLASASYVIKTIKDGKVVIIG